MLCAHLRPLAPSSSDFFALLPSPLPIPQGKRAMNSPEMKEARENQRKFALLSTRSIGGGGGAQITPRHLLLQTVFKVQKLAQTTFSGSGFSPGLRVVTL